MGNERVVVIRQFPDVRAEVQRRRRTGSCSFSVWRFVGRAGVIRYPINRLPSAAVHSQSVDGIPAALVIDHCRGV